MSKNCIITTVKSKIKGNATSYIERENEIIIPVSNKFTLSQTRAIAIDKVKKINKEYLSEKFGDVVSLNTSYTDGTGINIHPSKRLVDAYEVKEGNKTLEEVNSGRDLNYFNGDVALYEQEQRDFENEANLMRFSELRKELRVQEGKVNFKNSIINGFDILSENSVIDKEISQQQAKTIFNKKNKTSQDKKDLSIYFANYFLNSVYDKEGLLHLGYTRFSRYGITPPKLLIVKDNGRKNPFFQYNNVVIIGLDQIEDLISTVKTPSFEKFENLINTVAQEEIIHLYADYILDHQDIDNIYNEMTEKDINQIKKIYGNSSIQKENIVHEYIRMVVQQRVFGKTTEYETFTLSNAIMSFFENLLERLNDFLNTIIGSTNTQKAIEDVINFTKGNFSKELDDKIINRVFNKGQILEANLNVLNNFQEEQKELDKIVKQTNSIEENEITASEIKEGVEKPLYSIENNKIKARKSAINSKPILSNSESSFSKLNNKQTYPEIDTLFQENSELASQIYEALGFKQKQYASKLKEISERRKLATKWDLENSQLIKDIRVDKTQPKELKPNAADNNLAAIMLYGMKMSELEDKGLPEEMMEATTLAYRILNDFMFDINELSFYQNILLENPEYAQTLTTNENPVKEFFENDIFEQVEKDKFQITPQQKQQAISIYSQYLEQNPNGNIEQFKSWVDEFNNLNKKDYSLIRNIESLKEGDFIQEGNSVAKIVNIDKENQKFDFIRIDYLNKVESNNYNWYKDFFKSGQHKIKKATNKSIEKFTKSEQILKAIYDKNKNIAKSSIGKRFLKNFLGYNYNENKILTEYLNSTKKIDTLDVLSIIEKTDNEFKYIAKIIKDIIINNNYEISITQNNEKEGVAGDYIDGKINMYISTNDSQYTRVIIHELLHAISDNNVFQHKIDKLYNYVTKFLKDNNIDYGLKNNREFLAEIFSNKVFQELMAQFEYSEPNQNKKLSVLDKFLELLSSFFKIENNSVLKEAFLILEDISKYNTLNTNSKNQNFLFSKKLNSLSDFITQKSQERLNQIQDIFNENPELSKIGTVEQYASYLDTIFPNSKVKDIVYHGTKGEKFDLVDFSKNIFGGNVFYVNIFKDEAKRYATNKGNIISLLINAKNIQFQRDAYFGNRPQSADDIRNEINSIKSAKFALQFIEEEDYVRVFDTLEETEYFAEHNSGWTALEDSFKKQYLIKLQDSLKQIEKNGEFDTVLTNNDGGDLSIYIVNKLEQIHVIGSKNDINGFKDFMSFENSEFSKYGTYQQFRDFVTSKSSIEIENRLIETGKIDRVC